MLNRIFGNGSFQPSFHELKLSVKNSVMVENFEEFSTIYSNRGSLGKEILDSVLKISFFGFPQDAFRRCG
jgi:hypothetical protein